jgi:hypothetical protein
VLETEQTRVHEALTEPMTTKQVWEKLDREIPRHTVAICLHALAHRGLAEMDLEEGVSAGQWRTGLGELMAGIWRIV